MEDRRLEGGGRRRVAGMKGERKMVMAVVTRTEMKRGRNERKNGKVVCVGKDGGRGGR